MNKTELWDSYRGVIRSRKGGWRIGTAVLNHGYSMMDDLVGKTSYFQVLVLNCCGRLPDRPLADWLEALFICLSWPDPRIWCNQIGALGASMRTEPAAAVTAGVLAADSRMYAAGVIPACCDFMLRARAEQLSGKSIETIINEELERKRLHSKSKPVLSGYARPIATGDERVVAMRRVGANLGFEPGVHEQLALAIHADLLANHNEAINVAGYCVAVLLDHGFTISEQNLLFSTWVHSGVHACYADALTKPAGTFLPMRCSDIDYRGPRHRPLPDTD